MPRCHVSRFQRPFTYPRTIFDHRSCDFDVASLAFVAYFLEFVESLAISAGNGYPGT